MKLKFLFFFKKKKINNHKYHQEKQSIQKMP
jgi:hypothetical protein